MKVFDSSPCRCPIHDSACTRAGHPMSLREWQICSSNCPPEKPCHENASGQARYQWDRQTPEAAVCQHLGNATGEKVQCPSCQGTVLIKIMACAVHGHCSTHKQLPGIACCVGCKEYSMLAQPSVQPVQ